VICSTFQNDLFKKEYPKIVFVNPGDSVSNILGQFRLGVFYDENRNVDYTRHPTNPIKEPLLKIPADILGLS